VAKALKVSKETVRSHTAYLVENKALIRNGRSKPQFYHKGPNYALFCKSSTHDIGYVNLVPDYRFHNLSAKCDILKGKCPNLDAIEWTRTWTPRPGETFRSLHIDPLGATVLVYEEKSIVIRLDDTEVPADPDSLRNANGHIQQRFYQVVKYLSKELNFGLSLPEVNMDMHIARELPELNGVKTGKIGIDENTWIDDSLKGKPEIETDKIATVITKEEIARYLPTLIEQVRNLCVKVEHFTDANLKVVDVFGKALTKITEQNEIQSKFLKKLTGEYEPEENPPGDDRGYG
jgi:hypothetical protein